MRWLKITKNEMKSIKRYVPELTYQFISQSNYENKDHLYVICDMIDRITIYRKEDEYTKFRDIPQCYFTNIITNYDVFKKAMFFLLENKVIECDGLYSKKDGKALGYKISNEYVSKLVPIQLSWGTIIRKIVQNVNESKNATNKRLKPYRDYFMKNFKIDYDGALNWLNNYYENEFEKVRHSNEEIIKLINKYNRLFISISAINDGDLFFRKNTTNGRIDTNLTSLKKEFKKFISIQDLFQVDIKNSQPYFLSTILTSLLCSTKFHQSLTTIEVETFQKWCLEGKLYENFSKEYERITGKTLTRTQIKEMMFCIFYSKNASYRKEKSIFKTIFPSILEWIEKQKEQNHNQFSIKLQKIESEICIDEILPLLEEAGIRYLTIHDSWLVNKADLQKAIKIIEDRFMEKFGNKPSLSVEDIKNPDKPQPTLFEKPKQKILYKGFKEIEIETITKEDIETFLKQIKLLEREWFGVSEDLLVHVCPFQPEKTLYLYEKYLKKVSLLNNIE